LTIHTYSYNSTNTDTYTDIHPLIIVARVLALTHMAKDCVEDVRRVLVIIITLGIIVQTSMGNATINTSTIFVFNAATRSDILKGGDINTGISAVHCKQVARVTNFKALKPGQRPSSTALVWAPVPPALTSPLPSHSAAATPSAAGVGTIGSKRGYHQQTHLPLQRHLHE